MSGCVSVCHTSMCVCHPGDHQKSTDVESRPQQHHQRRRLPPEGRHAQKQVTASHWHAGSEDVL